MTSKPTPTLDVGVELDLAFLRELLLRARHAHQATTIARGWLRRLSRRNWVAVGFVVDAERLIADVERGLEELLRAAWGAES